LDRGEENKGTPTVLKKCLQEVMLGTRREKKKVTGAHLRGQGPGNAFSWCHIISSGRGDTERRTGWKRRHDRAGPAWGQVGKKQ